MDDLSTNDRVKKILQNKFYLEDAQLEEIEKLEDFAMDSLERMELVLSLEDEFGVDIPDHSAEEFQTIEGIVEFLDAAAE